MRTILDLLEDRLRPKSRASLSNHRRSRREHARRLPGARHHSTKRALSPTTEEIRVYEYGIVAEGDMRPPCALNGLVRCKLQSKRQSHARINLLRHFFRNPSHLRDEEIFVDCQHLRHIDNRYLA